MRIAIFATRKEPSILTQISEIEKYLKTMNVDIDRSYFEDSLENMREDLEYTYNKVKKIIQKADVVIVEVTNYSTGMGLIIGRVIGYKKPILVLFNEDLGDHKDPSIIAQAHGNKKNKVFFKRYKSANLPTVLDEFIEESKKMLNTKYLFNLTPELAHYLQWASEKYNKPMVDILREQLQNRMDKDKDWKKHLADE